jgi:hypothetical protein
MTVTETCQQNYAHLRMSQSRTIENSKTQHTYLPILSRNEIAHQISVVISTTE